MGRAPVRGHAPAVDGGISHPRPAATVTAAGDRAGSVDAALVLLQQTAGNRAVTGAIQRKLSSGAPGARPTLTIGRSGEAVGVLQQKLNAARAATPPLIVDGEFGSKTFTAVRTFQKTNGLIGDGVVGKKTWGALDTQAPGGGPDPAGGELAVNGPDEANPVAVPDAGTSLHPIVGVGNVTTGPAVEELQQKLNLAGATPKVTVDGTVGPTTSQAIIAFQTANGVVPATGVADAATWTLLDQKGSGSSVGRVERAWHENVGGNPNIGMTSRYTWRLTPEDNPSTMEVRAKVKFTGLAPKASWPGLVSAAWDKFTAVNLATADMIDIRFVLESVASGEDNSVEVKAGAGRANAGEWFLGDTDEANTIPHEFGHLVGLQDEYQLSAADYERTTGRVAPVGATASTTGASSSAVASALKKALAGGGATGVADADAKQVITDNGLKQGMFAQQVAQRYAKSAGSDLVQDLRGLNSPDEFELVEPFVYSSGSMMGDAGRHAADNPHDHGVQPRHVREFLGYIRQWGLAHGIADRWTLV